MRNRAQGRPEYDRSVRMTGSSSDVRCRRSWFTVSGTIISVPFYFSWSPSPLLQIAMVSLDSRLIPQGELFHGWVIVTYIAGVHSRDNSSVLWGHEEYM